MGKLSSYSHVTSLTGTELVPIVVAPGVAGGNAYITADEMAAATPFSDGYVSIASSVALGTHVAEFWVSTAARASDSNSGAQYSPFATLGHAVAVAEAGAVPYRVNLGAGTFPISVADANTNGVTVTVPGSSIVGLGELLTTISITASGLRWGILLPANGQLKGVTISVATAITGPYWVAGVTVPASGHAENVLFEDVFGFYGDTVTVPTIAGGTSTQPPAFFALGPDLPGEGAMDIAFVQFNRCHVIGGAGIPAIAGFVFSNGTSQNVTANQLNGCLVSQTKYGATFASGGVVWTGGGITKAGTADFLISASAGDPIVLIGLRNENGNTFLASSFSDFGDLTVILDGCFAANHTPTVVAGRMIDFTCQGLLISKGSTFTTIAHNTTVALNTTNSTTRVPTYISIGDLFDNLTPFPAADLPHYNRTILAARYIDTGNVVSANPNYAHVTDLGTQYVPQMKWKTGYYFGTPNSSLATNLPAEGLVIVTGLMIPAGMALNEIAASITIVGGTGALVRLGVYSYDAGTWTLMQDAGTIDGTVLGDASKTLAIAARSVPWYALLAVCAQGAASPRPTMKGINPLQQAPFGFQTLANALTAEGAAAWIASTVAGALPSSGTAFNYQIAPVPRLFVKGTQS